jgi:hypothetical protein
LALAARFVEHRIGDRRVMSMIKWLAQVLRGLDGLLCCADERLSDLAISASYDLTPARRSHAPQPAAPIITVCFAGRLVVVPPAQSWMRFVTPVWARRRA